MLISGACIRRPLESVSRRYRDGVAIAALDRRRAGHEVSDLPGVAGSGEGALEEAAALSRSGSFEIGAIVIRQPLGDQRASSFQVTQIQDGRVYLVPCSRPNVRWVTIDSAAPLDSTKLESAA